MIPMPSINDQLRLHLLRGAGVAGRLRAQFAHIKGANWITSVDNFFRSTDDHFRLQASHRISMLLLRLHNMEYLNLLRVLVAEFEEMRLAAYKRQTDHTVHSLYLYFMGLWVFDRCGVCQKFYAEHQMPTTTPGGDVLRGFAFQWIFSSLLHDVGYLFENLGSPSRPSDSAFDPRRFRIRLDDIFNVDSMRYLRHHLPRAEDRLLVRVAARAEGSLRKWRDERLLPSYGSAQSPEAVLQELDKAPWLKELFEGATGSIRDFLTDRVLARRIHRGTPRHPFTALWKFAHHVAASGYGESGLGAGVVDHAFASGMLLFQLTSLRYWLFLGCGSRTLTRLQALWRERYWAGFCYSPDSLVESVAPACLAAAAHNFLPSVMMTKEMSRRDCTSSPLLFLSVVLDEFQRWHRPAVGSRKIRDLFKYRSIKVTDFFFGEPEVCGIQRIGLGCDDRRVSADLVDTVFRRVSKDAFERLFAFKGAAGRHNHDIEIERLLQMSSGK